MKKTRWQLVVLLSILAASSRAAQVESTSENFVGSAAQIAGNGGAGARLSIFSMRMVRPVCYAGSISTVETAALTDAGSTWTNNQFSGTNGSFYVDFDSGLLADIVSADGAAKRLSFTANLPASVTVGSKYKIRRHLTLAGAFGPNNESGLLAGQNPADADNVLLHDAQSQETRTYFFLNLPGFTGWYRTDYSPAADTVVYPEQGVMIRRKTDAALMLAWAGAAKKGPTMVPVFPGYNLVGTLRTRTSLRLADLNLLTGDIVTGFATGNNSTDADTVLLLNADGSTTTYFYSDYPGFTGWYDSTYRVATDVPVAPGTAFFLNRKAPRAVFYWSIPGE